MRAAPTGKRPARKPGIRNAALGGGGVSIVPHRNFLAERARCDTADLVTADADVVQGLVGQIAQLGERATILDPVVGDAKRVHGCFLFRLDLLRPFRPRFKLDVVIHANNYIVQCKLYAPAMHLSIGRTENRRGRKRRQWLTRNVKRFRHLQEVRLAMANTAHGHREVRLRRSRVQHQVPKTKNRRTSRRFFGLGRTVGRELSLRGRRREGRKIVV